MAMKDPGAWIIGHKSVEDIMRLHFNFWLSYSRDSAYRIANHPFIGRYAESRKGGLSVLIMEAGASAIVLYGNEPVADPSTQNL